MTKPVNILVGYAIHQIVDDIGGEIAAGNLPPKADPLIHIFSSTETVTAGAAEQFRFSGPDFFESLLQIGSGGV